MYIHMYIDFKNSDSKCLTYFFIKKYLGIYSLGIDI